MKSISIFGVALSLLILSTASHAITLSWVGCGITKKAFMQELAAAYQKKTGIEITISGGGATKGIQSVTDHEADLGGSCRYRIEGEAPKSKVRFNPVAWDALIVAVHKSNPVDTISMAQLQQLYRGEIDNWRQLGGSDQPVELLVHNGKISGVGLTIRQLVFSDPEMDFPLDHTYKSSGPLEEAIEQNPNAVGMTGISSGRKRDFKILKLDGKEPSFDNIKTGSYMLYRPEWR